MSTRLFTLLAMIVALALAACGAGFGDGGEVSNDGDAEAAVAPEVEPNGKVIDIAMYTRDPDDTARMHVFKPTLIKAKVGDTVRFMPIEPTHLTASIAGMLPKGARGWEGEVNQEVTYVLPKPGIYGYKCTPHYAAGMVGLIIVEGEGDTANLAEAKNVSHPGLAGKAFKDLFAQAGL